MLESIQSESSPIRSGSLAGDPVPPPAELGLITVCRGSMVESVGELRRRLSTLMNPMAFDPQAVLPMLVPDLMKRLKSVVIRPMVVELHSARLTGRLSGDTPEERFRSFVEQLEEPAVRAQILGDYPKMAARIEACCRRWRDVCSEWLDRLERDYPELCRRLGDSTSGSPGRLSAVLGQSGDLHRGGRRVVILEMDNGTRWVYKPRSLALDVLFQDLLQRLPEFEFRALRTVDRGDYGWVEYVDYAECADDPERRRFYFRLGGLLALLYALQANDFHHENVIACGPHPMLVDLETLLHPIVFDHTLHSEKFSVLDVGILPVEQAGGAGLSLSALGADSNREVNAMGWNGVGTDEQRFGQRTYGLKEVTSRPARQDAALDRHHADALIEGFRRAYGSIARNKPLWIAELERFAEATVRCVLRPTAAYQSLLRNLYHPARSRSAAGSERLLEELAAEIPYRPHLQAVLDSERVDLKAGDVPIFHLRPGDTALFDSRGRRIPSFFPQSSLQAVRRRIERFSERDLAKQEGLIRQSLALLDDRPARKTTRSAFHAAESVEPASFLQRAQRIGDFLGARAVPCGPARSSSSTPTSSAEGSSYDTVTWAGYHRVGNRFMFSYLPPTLYSGQLGIIWFLAQLAEQTGLERYRTYARRGLAFFREQQLARLIADGRIGAFDGLSGAAYVLGHLAVLWPELELAEEVERIVTRVEEQIEGDRKLDIVSGAAGCLSVMFGLYRATESARFLQTAKRCGQVLMSSVDLNGDETSWKSEVFETPQTGFSHGLTGFAWALAQLSEAAPSDALQQRIGDLLTYEDQYFDSARRNWRDLRRPDPNAPPTDGFMWAWCHGAPGIVAGRYATAKYLPAPLAAQALERAESALPALFENGGSSDMGLCHGTAGNLDLLLSVAQERNDAELIDQTRRFMGGAVARLEASGFLACRADDRRLGLMLGLSGIGYTLLRMHAPSAVPSVLLLDGERKEVC